MQRYSSRDDDGGNVTRRDVDDEGTMACENYRICVPSDTCTKILNQAGITSYLKLEIKDWTIKVAMGWKEMKLIN